MPWRSLLRPIRDGTLVPKVVRKPPVAPTPTEAEFVSPLRVELRSLLDVKAGIGYATNCPRCQNQSNFDTRIAQVVATKEDTAPYLAETRKELIALRESNARLTKQLEESKTWQQPITRLRLGIYTAAGSGLVMAGITVVKWVLGIP
jgi:hypothetical protein